MSSPVVDAPEGDSSAAVPDPAVDSPQDARPSSSPTSLQAAELLQIARNGCNELTALCESAPALRDGLDDGAQITSVASASLRAIAPYIEGQRLSLEDLVQALSQSAVDDPQAVQNKIKNILFTEATRKSYCHDKQRAKRASVMEDAQPALLWRWEVKKLGSLAAEKAHATAVRAWFKQAQAWMIAQQASIKALQSGVGTDKARLRVQAALAKAESVPHPGPIPEPGAEVPTTGKSARQSSASAACAKDTSAPEGAEHATSATAPLAAGEQAEASHAPEVADTAGAPAAPQAGAKTEKDHSAALAAADRVAQRAIAETEKARKVEEAAAKRRQKEEAAAAKAREKEAKEAAKSDKKAASLGFGSQGALGKSAGIMAQFVQRKSVEQPASQEQAAPSATELEAELQRVYTETEHLRAALHAQEPIDAPAVWHAMLYERWKARPAAARVPGRPPSWARRPGCPVDPAALAAKVFGSGEEWQGVRTWRRKLVHFPSDGPRPPFYGSFSRRSKNVRPRAPLGRAADMDYDVLSDEEWEEEPEGEELGGGDGDDDDDERGSDDEDDGFMVEDGYLSADEQMQNGASSGDESDGDAAEHGPVVDFALLKGAERHAKFDDATTAYFNALLAGRTHAQPFVICRLAGMAPSQEAVKLRSPDLLSALRMHVTDSAVTVVPATATDEAAPRKVREASKETIARREAAAAALGPFIDSLDDEAAKGKAKLVDAFLATDGAALRVARSRLHNTTLPACGAFCKALGRWVSNDAAAVLQCHLQTAPPPAALRELATQLNSAALQRHVGGSQTSAITAFAAAVPADGTPESTPPCAARGEVAGVAAGGVAAPRARRIAPQPAVGAAPAKRVASVPCTPVERRSEAVRAAAITDAPLARKRRIAPLADTTPNPPRPDASTACAAQRGEDTACERTAGGIIEGKRTAASLRDANGAGAHDESSDPPLAKAQRTIEGMTGHVTDAAAQGTPQVVERGAASADLGHASAPEPNACGSSPYACG